ncbi:MAG: cytochrome c5 family protein [Rhodoferax sp.]|jgi:cytochrome c5|nr:cytochrome c5 family protein [Rhodoferax sp.]
MIKQQVVNPLSLVFLATFSLFFSPVQAADKTGQAVVEAVCANCHVSGKDGAPRIGDVPAWTEHAKKGLVKLAENAIAGINKMPAHGGQPSLSDLEMSRAVAYMVSAGKAADPKKPYASPTSITGEQLVHERCMTCHEEGKEGAPRIDDFAAWKPRLQKGVEGLVQSSITGHNAMPSRAGMANLSDSDMRNAVTYLVVQSATYKPQK